MYELSPVTHVHSSYSYFDMMEMEKLLFYLKNCSSKKTASFQCHSARVCNIVSPMCTIKELCNHINVYAGRKLCMWTWMNVA